MKLILKITAVIVLLIASGCANNKIQVRDDYPNISAEEILKEEDIVLREELTKPQDWRNVCIYMVEFVEQYRKEEALPYKIIGQYHLSGKRLIYSFEKPNDFYQAVILREHYENDDQDFVMVIHNSGNIGMKFGTILKKGYNFLGLTEHYCLFMKDKEIVAVSIEPKKINDVYINEEVKFEDLPQNEKNSVIYPSGKYVCTF